MLRNLLPALLLVLATAVSAAPPLPPERPKEFISPEAKPQPEAKPSPDGKPEPSPAAQSSTTPTTNTCAATLKLAGHQIEIAHPPPGQNAACTIEHPVRLSAISTPHGAVILPDQPLLACDTAAALAGFVSDVAAPLAKSVLASPLASLGTGPGYDCRPTNRVAGAKISAHGQGLAVDVMVLTMQDKRRILIAGAHDAATRAYLRAVRTAGCGWFTTILGPGSDAAHADHIHFDLKQHGRSEQTRLCD